MKLVKPNAVRLITNSNNEHVAKCAAICYATESISDYDKFCERRLETKHYSVFRHATHYYKISHFNGLNKEFVDVLSKLENNPLVGYVKTEMDVFISLNGHFAIDNPEIIELFEPYSVSKEQIINDGIYDIIRETFIITTQISTSRELNRVSPNNICEESTRYCNYSSNKFNSTCKLCVPWWLKCNDILFDYDDVYANKVTRFLTCTDKTTLKRKLLYIDDYIENELECKEDIYNDNFALYYMSTCEYAFDSYIQLTQFGMKPQDARGVLPLDTATTVAYTYTLKEWKDIIDKRVHNVTGAAHPNAKLVIEMVKQQIKDIYGKYPL